MVLSVSHMAWQLDAKAVGSGHLSVSREISSWQVSHHLAYELVVEENIKAQVSVRLCQIGRPADEMTI